MFGDVAMARSLVVSNNVTVDVASSLHQMDANDTRHDINFISSKSFSLDGRNGAMLRAFYVIMGVTIIVVVYFTLRAVRLRRKKNKSHKYGVVAQKEDLEMTPLDQDDDDETTVFEVSNNHSRN